MGIRVLLVLVVLVASYGCGQSSSAPAESEKEGGMAQQEGPPASNTKDCSDFYGPQDAQAYFESKATSAEKRSLNPDGDEWACNEGGVTFKPEPDITLASFGGLTDRESWGLLQCQFIEYAQDHGQEAANEYVENKIDDEQGNAEVTSVQEHFIKDGYSCTWDEINATLTRLQQAKSASASSSAP